MQRHRLIAAALMSAFIAAAVAAPQAVAAPSSVTIEVNNDPPRNALQGIVDSPRGACVGDRKVKLYYSVGGPFEHIATDTKTTNNGVWRLYYNPNKRGGPPIPSGDYRAKVTRKKLGAGQCDPATSPPITVP